MLARVVLCVVWVALAVAWLSGISLVAKLVGGYQWLAHTGQMGQVTTKVLLSALCVGAGGALLLVGRVNKPLAIALGVVVGLHVFNAIGLLLGVQGVGGAFRLPFALVASVFPTTSGFVGMPTGNVSYFLLPAATLVAFVVSLRVGRVATASDGAA